MSSAGETALSESELVRRARKADGRAWEMLVALHQEKVFRLAYLILGDPDEAEDIAQETMVRAYHALHRFDMERPLRPWLLTIAGNAARNRKRALGRYLAALGRLFIQDVEPVHYQRNEYSRADVAETLWKAVKELNQPDQSIIYLRIFLELSVEEVSQTLGIAEGTVKSRLSRALGRLRDLIETYYPELIEL